MKNILIESFNLNVFEKIVIRDSKKLRACVQTTWEFQNTKSRDNDWTKNW